MRTTGKVFKAGIRVSDSETEITKLSYVFYINIQILQIYVNKSVEDGEDIEIQSFF